MTQNKPIIRILNATDVVADTSASANAMVAAGAGIVELKDLGGSFSKFDFKKRKSIDIARSLTETRQVLTASFTAANNTEYSFSITQDVDIDGTGKRSNTEIITFKSDASGTNAEIEAGLKSAIEAYTAINRLKVTVVAGGSGSIAITADADYPLFSASNISNMTSIVDTYGTFAAGVQSVVAGDSTPGTMVAQSGGLITLTTAASHSVVVGQKVSVPTATDITVVKDGVTYTGEIPPTRVAAVTSTTMVLDAGAVGSGTCTATGSDYIYVEAVEGFGLGADLTDAGIVDSFESSEGTAVKSVFSSAKKYTKVSILAYASKGFGGFNQSSGDQLEQIDLYYDEAAAAYATSVGVGNATPGRVEEVKNGHAFGATTADPLLI